MKEEININPAQFDLLTFCEFVALPYRTKRKGKLIKIRPVNGDIQKIEIAISRVKYLKKNTYSSSEMAALQNKQDELNKLLEMWETAQTGSFLTSCYF